MPFYNTLRRRGSEGSWSLLDGNRARGPQRKFRKSRRSLRTGSLEATEVNFDGIPMTEAKVLGA